MRIGLVGFYGFEAYSDELIAKAIRDSYDEKADVEWTMIPFNEAPPTDLDLIILGGGSLLGHPFGSLVNALKGCDTPFLILGTGFREAVAMDDLRYLWERAALIAVRGHISKMKLRRHGLDVGKINVIGDSIFLLPPKGAERKDYIGAVVRPHVVSPEWMLNSLKRLSDKRGQEAKIFCFSKAQEDLGVQLSLDETYRGIIESSYWFGNRLHPFCVALINGIPALAVELEFNKVGDVCTTIGANAMIYPTDVIDAYLISLRVKPGDRIAQIRQDLNKLVEESLTL